ncbi:exported protein of unknown function [Methanoculleus bourgensis]|uniref:Phosphoglycerate kinase n=1 Tax=Methanoculleus bourgensis TaxID=83986 RepID=A0A0X3BPW2_9EURY|nr:exported protein of unknown function [Methanoculleus bourgensis]
MVVKRLRLALVANRLSMLLGQPVLALQDCIGPEVESAVAGMSGGDVVLLENLRFHPEERADDPAFAEQLASLAEIYVNDAFGASHRPMPRSWASRSTCRRWPGSCSRRNWTPLSAS